MQVNSPILYKQEVTSIFNEIFTEKQNVMCLKYNNSTYLVNRGTGNHIVSLTAETSLQLTRVTWYKKQKKQKSKSFTKDR